MRLAYMAGCTAGCCWRSREVLCCDDTVEGGLSLLPALPPDGALLSKACSSWKETRRLQLHRRAGPAMSCLESCSNCSAGGRGRHCCAAMCILIRHMQFHPHPARL